MKRRWGGDARREGCGRHLLCERHLLALVEGAEGEVSLGRGCLSLTVGLGKALGTQQHLSHIEHKGIRHRQRMSHKSKWGCDQAPCSTPQIEEKVGIKVHNSTSAQEGREGEGFAYTAAPAATNRAGDGDPAPRST